MPTGTGCDEFVHDRQLAFGPPLRIHAGSMGVLALAAVLGLQSVGAQAVAPGIVHAGLRTSGPELDDFRLGLHHVVHATDSGKPSERGLRWHSKPSDHLPGDVDSVGLLMADLRMAGVRRLIVAGPDGTGVTDAMRGFASPGDSDCWTDEDLLLAHGRAPRNFVCYPRSLSLQTQDQDAEQTRFFDSPLDGSAWMQMHNAVCRPSGVGYRLSCPEGTVVPPRPVKELRNDMGRYADTFDWYRRANAQGLPAVLVVPHSHWQGDGRLVQNRYASMSGLMDAKTRELMHAFLVVGSLAMTALNFLVVPVERLNRFARLAPLAMPVISELMESADPEIQPTPDREAFLRNVTAMGDVVLEVNDAMTIVGPAEFADVFRRFAERNAAA